MKKRKKSFMRIEDLIGYRLVSGNNEGFVVENDGKKYFLEIIDDGGDCCGFNDIITNFDLKEKPIITRVEIKKCNEVFDDPGDTARITFFGLNKEIGKIESNSNSGSGWSYGACVSIICKDLCIREVITKW